MRHAKFYFGINWALILWKLNQFFKEAKIQNDFERDFEHKRNIKMNIIFSKLIRSHIKFEINLVYFPVYKINLAPSKDSLKTNFVYF